MPKLKLKDNVSKVCVVLYNMNDVRRCVDFAKKYNFYYYYIEHKPGNEDLKVHYHVIIESDSYHRFVVSSLVSETAPINLFSKCDSVSAYLRYILHLDYIDKVKYDVSDIVSNNSIDNINKMVDLGSKKQSEINNENFILLL